MQKKLSIPPMIQENGRRLQKKIPAMQVNGKQA